MEPFTHALEPPPGDVLGAFAAMCDVLSPNELEARSMLGPARAEAPALELATRLLDAGATTILVAWTYMGFWCPASCYLSLSAMSPLCILAHRNYIHDTQLVSWTR